MGSRRAPFDFATRLTWSEDEAVALLEKMRGSPQGFRVAARSAALLTAALAYYHREAHQHAEDNLSYRVDEWTAGRLTACLARAGSLTIARAAYEAALADRPRGCITLRQGIRMLSERPAPE